MAPTEATPPDPWSQLAAWAPELGLYMGTQVAVFIPCLIFVKRTWPKHKDPWTLADTLVSLGIFPLMTMSALVGVVELQGDLEGRWRRKTRASQFLFLLYISRGVLHCFMQCMEKMSRSHFLMMTAHHILSLLCFGSGLATGRMHFWGCLDGCCEMSTVFLNNLYLSKELTVGGRELKEIVPNWLYGLNGFLLWLSFLFFRIMLFPYWLYVWHGDVTASPAATWDRCNYIEQYLYPGVTLFLFFLSAYWFINVTKGMLKALGLSGSKKQKEKGKAE